MAGHFTPTPGEQPVYTQNQYVEQAAIKWGIPAWVLYGVWGIESSFGQNVATSSAGAEGDFQFIPSTAASYGYPETNNPSPTQFEAQADGAAHYLSDLFKKTGSWNAALEAYSGGGYGAPQVQAKYDSAPKGLNPTNLGKDPISNTIGTFEKLPGEIGSIPGAIVGVFNSAVADAKYAALLLVAIVVAGYLVVHGLTGSKPSPTILLRGAPAAA